MAVFLLFPKQQISSVESVRLPGPCKQFLPLSLKTRFRPFSKLDLSPNENCFKNHFADIEKSFNWNQASKGAWQRKEKYFVWKYE
jgi:hypothetical protein